MKITVTTPYSLLQLYLRIPVRQNQHLAWMSSADRTVHY